MSVAINANPTTEMLSQGPEYCVASFATINEMRANSQLCDITLEVGGETLDAHKVVLASASQYFFEVFNGSMLEHTLGIVHIRDVDVVTIKHLIDYIYTGELSITEHNVRVLLPASSLLQLHSVREACCKFLLRQLNTSNCLNIMSFANTHLCKELHTACHKYILHHFQQVVEYFRKCLWKGRRLCIYQMWMAIFLTVFKTTIKKIFKYCTTEMLSQGPEYCVASFATINEMRANSQLCDITLEVGGETLDAHKVVLASASQYFFEVFNGSMLEHTLGIVHIRDVDVVAIKHLIDYIYTGELSITEQNVRVLLSASSLLQLHSVREACCKFLLRQLHTSNCLNIMSFANTHLCKELHTACHKYILHHFQQVVELEEFLPLAFEEVRDLISNNLLNICSEETVFNAVLDWIKHDLDNRQKHIAELMRHVRLPLVNRNFLITRVVTEPLIRDDPQCKELLIEAMKYQLMPEQQSLMGSQMTQERRRDGMKPYVCAVGGSSGAVSQFEVYNPRSNAWFTIAPMLSKRYGAAMTTLHNTLYVMGGCDYPTGLATAESYIPLTNQWNYITPMGTKRYGLGACAFDGWIYVCGGEDDDSCLSSTERYNPLTSTWNSCPSMNTPRKWCRLAVLDNCIYCCGGEDSTNNILSCVERFDPRIGRWYPVPCMTSQRSSPGVASCDGFLYCIGGDDGGMSTSSGERFNLRTNTWETIAAMNSSRRGLGLVEVEGFLYALGGHDGSSSLNSVERYDIHLNKWTIVNSMVTEREELCAAVLNCIDLERGLV